MPPASRSIGAASLPPGASSACPIIPGVANATGSKRPAPRNAITNGEIPAHETNGHSNGHLRTRTGAPGRLVERSRQWRSRRGERQAPGSECGRTAAGRHRRFPAGPHGWTPRTGFRTGRARSAAAGVGPRLDRRHGAEVGHRRPPGREAPLLGPARGRLHPRHRRAGARASRRRRDGDTRSVGPGRCELGSPRTAGRGAALARPADALVCPPVRAERGRLPHRRRRPGPRRARSRRAPAGLPPGPRSPRGAPQHVPRRQRGARPPRLRCGRPRDRGGSVALRRGRDVPRCRRHPGPADRTGPPPVRPGGRPALPPPHPDPIGIGARRPGGDAPHHRRLPVDRGVPRRPGPGLRRGSRWESRDVAAAADALRRLRPLAGRDAGDRGRGTPLVLLATATGQSPARPRPADRPPPADPPRRPGPHLSGSPGARS